MPMPSNTDTTNTAAGMGPAADFRWRLGDTQLRRSAVNLQIGHQRLQITQRDGVGSGADSFPVLLHGQFAVVQGVVENRAGVLPIAVLGAGRRCCPATEGRPEPFRHGHDRRSLRRVRHRI